MIAVAASTKTVAGHQKLIYALDTATTVMAEGMAPLSGVLPTPTLFSFMLTNGPTNGQ